MPPGGTRRTASDLCSKSLRWVFDRNLSTYPLEAEVHATTQFTCAAPADQSLNVASCVPRFHTASRCEQAPHRHIDARLPCCVTSKFQVSRGPLGSSSFSGISRLHHDCGVELPIHRGGVACHESGTWCMHSRGRPNPRVALRTSAMWSHRSVVDPRYLVFASCLRGRVSETSGRRRGCRESTSRRSPIPRVALRASVPVRSLCCVR